MLSRLKVKVFYSLSKKILKNRINYVSIGSNIYNSFIMNIIHNSFDYIFICFIPT